MGRVLLNENQTRDLVLWLRFLDAGAKGISINRIICRWPTRVIRVDACPQGIGGYCLSSGIAWRYQLPEELMGRVSLNTLEFLVAYIGAKVELNHGPKWTQDDTILSQGDSTLAAGWVKKSSFNDACPIHLDIARDFASLCMEKEINHYTQWFPGKKNIVTGALSRDFEIPDKNLTRTFWKGSERV